MNATNDLPYTYTTDDYNRPCDDPPEAYLLEEEIPVGACYYEQVAVAFVAFLFGLPFPDLSDASSDKTYHRVGSYTAAALAMVPEHRRNSPAVAVMARVGLVAREIFHDPRCFDHPLPSNPARRQATDIMRKNWGLMREAWCAVYEGSGSDADEMREWFAEGHADYSGRGLP